MSVTHTPLRVDWPVFLAAFPKPGAWAKPCKKALQFDDDGFSHELVPVYTAVRGQLSAQTVRGLDRLVAAIAVHGLPKKSGFDTSSVYVPHCKFRKADFAGGDTDSPIPQSSPEQVGMILDTMATADLKALAKALKAAWPELEPQLSRFESPAEYVGHLKNWVRILEEIRSQGGGLAIDLG